MKKKKTSDHFLGWTLLTRLFFFVLFSFFLLSSGTIESEDGWLFLSVSRNIYYTHRIQAQPDEYPTRENVHMNSVQAKDGTWRAPGSLGFSLSMLPAVALSDVYHTITHTPLPVHFPLETDWSLLFFASFSNSIAVALLACVSAQYAVFLSLKKRSAILLALATVFLTNIAPVATFGFAHTWFSVFLVAAFLSIKALALTQKKVWILGIFISFMGILTSYNFTYFLAFPALFLYIALVFPRPHLPRKITLLLFGIGVFASLMLGPTLLWPLREIRIHPKVTIEGMWGLLFSSGKSIFLYSPLLIVLPVFWHKLPHIRWKEWTAFGTLTLTYLLFISLSHLDKGPAGIFPIWYGGAVWGPRYLVSLIPFLMLAVAEILRSFSRIQQALVLVPLTLISLWIQLIGVAVPYQVQYRGLPYNTFIAQHELTVYDYASFLPRFSPLFTQSKEFIQKLRRFPATISHGTSDVRFFDGFNTPLYTGGHVFRGFLTQGNVVWKPQSDTATINLELFLAPDRPTATDSATMQLVTSEKTHTIVLPVQQDTPLTLQTTGNELTLKRIDDASRSSQLVYIKRMSVNQHPVNLATLDYPYLDLNRVSTHRLPHRYWGVAEKNPWALWDMRSRLYEESFSFWWIRSFYYWDTPHLFLKILFVGITSGTLLSGVLLYARTKNLRE